jgi:hypothetical protein
VALFQRSHPRHLPAALRALASVGRGGTNCAADFLGIFSADDIDTRA